MSNSSNSINMLPGLDKVPIGDSPKQIQVTFPQGSMEYNVINTLMRPTGLTPRAVVKFIIKEWLLDNPQWVDVLLESDQAAILRGMDNGRGK